MSVREIDSVKDQVGLQMLFGTLLGVVSDQAIRDYGFKGQSMPCQQVVPI
jgi:hypothetical protein